jgi:N-acetylglucosaminyldiphosphoundecaprenol N-acetyl-beta-D-mannosaminyltransferase
MAFHDVTLARAVEIVEGFILEGRPRKVLCANVALYVGARRSPELWELYRRSDLLTVDGWGIYHASRLLGDPAPKPVSGIDLMFALIERAAERGYRIYIVGAADEVLKAAVTRLRQQHPSLRIVGWHHGYYDVAEEDDVGDLVRAAAADLVLLATSSPQKERFAERQAGRGVGGVFVAVGGSIDIAAGRYRRAPEWVRLAGLEWVYRLVQEPRRLWRRYLVTNALFGIIVGVRLLNVRSSRAARRLRVAMRNLDRRRRQTLVPAAALPVDQQQSDDGQSVATRGPV